MLKPLHLAVLLCSALFSFSQKTETITLFYKSNQYLISKKDKDRLDSFISKGWDKISISGYTDDTDEEDYNTELSKKRSGQVYDYLISKNIPAIVLTTQFFGETMPVADNETEDGGAQNRRTDITGFQYARIQPKPTVDPMTPVTNTLDNGFIITYKPGGIPASMAANLAAGSGIDFRFVTNTVEMRQNNLFNNTTRGEILSSVLIICGNQLNPCKLDSPVVVKVPIPFKTKCPVEKVKFFNAVAERGKQIWQEESKELYPETINGVQYIRLRLDNLCQCINFDFKVNPDCFDTDSTRLFYVNKNSIRNMTTELKGLNSVYMPRKINDTTLSLVYLKDKLKDAVISFSLYDGRRRIRSFRDQQIESFPYDSASGQYLLLTSKEKFHFPREKVSYIVLKVNGDKYRVLALPGKNKFEFIYLNRKEEKIVVDFYVSEKGRIRQYLDQPLESIPLNEVTGYRVIDKNFLKELRLKKDITVRQKNNNSPGQ